MPLFKRTPKPSRDDDLSLSDALLQGQDMIRRTGSAHHDRWGLGTAERWDLDQRSGLLRWTFPDRVAEAPAQILGTYSPGGRSWMWAWANESLLPHLRSASEAVRDWGARKGHPALASAQLDGVTEEQAGELAAIAFRVTRATGFYRAPAGRSHLYLTFGPVVITTGGGQSDTFAIDAD